MKNILVIFMMLGSVLFLTNCGEEGVDFGGAFVTPEAPRTVDYGSNSSSEKVTCVRGDSASLTYILGGQSGEYVCTLDIEETGKQYDWNAKNNANYCRNVLNKVVAEQRKKGFRCN